MRLLDVVSIANGQVDPREMPYRDWPLIGFHGMDDAFYVQNYGAKLWGHAGAEHAHGLTADHLLTADGPLPVPGTKLFMFEDTVKAEAALLVEKAGLLITCDSVQHWEKSGLMSPMAKVVTKLMGFQHPAQIGPPWSKKMTKEGGTLRPDFDRLVALPFTAIIGGHGGLLRTGGPARLQDSIDRKYGSA